MVDTGAPVKAGEGRWGPPRRRTAMSPKEEYMIFPRGLALSAAFATLAGALFAVDAVVVTSRALGDTLVLAGAVFAFGGVMALLPRGRR
ncbi:hypothetical protein CEDDRAFT_03495 [Frankia sp. CeD]|nr:hypothetical protein BMG523Draft_03435 [Frankia sp. BMG5.23]KEZ35159.1 hypothetical protein CEDDRAFT_03495 [Frankia sp. CeD]